MDGKVSDHLPTGHSELQAEGCGILFSTSLEGDSEQPPEIGIGELESLLRVDSRGEKAAVCRQMTDYVTVDSSDIGSLFDNTKSRPDFVHHGVKQESSTLSHDVYEGSSSSSEEDSSEDTAWSYRTHTARHQRRHSRRRLRPSRGLSAARNKVADERKKQQNKSAATRYREKKRAEEMENELMCAALEKRNKELRTRVQGMTQEVAMLRRLVIDVFRT